MLLSRSRSYLLGDGSQRFCIYFCQPNRLIEPARRPTNFVEPPVAGPFYIKLKFARTSMWERAISLNEGSDQLPNLPSVASWVTT